MRKIFTLFAVIALIAIGAVSAVASSDVELTTIEADDIDRHGGGTGEITEEVISFDNEGGTVYGTLVMPANARRRTPTVLMFHGFTGNRDEGPVFQPDFTFTDTMYSRTAAVLAENGMASLRIDFRGSGESLDQFGFEETTFTSQLSDGYAAVEWLEDDRRFGRIGVLGLSQGGLVAAITAESHRGVDSLVLWSPVANPVDTYKTVLGAELVGQDSEGNNVFGESSVLVGLTQPTTDMILPWGAPLTMEQSFFQELYTTDPIAAISHYRKPMQVVVGALDTIVTPQPYYGQLYLTYHDGYEELVVVDGDHVFDVFAGNGAPALDVAIAESVDWFQETLRHRRWW